MIGWATGRADHPWSAAGTEQGQLFAAGRTKVGARFIVPSASEVAVKPRPYPRPPCVGRTADRGRSALPDAGGSGWRLAVWNKIEQRETGDRMIGWAAHFQVSGLSHQDPGTGHQVQVRGRD